MKAPALFFLLFTGCFFLVHAQPSSSGLDYSGFRDSSEVENLIRMAKEAKPDVRPEILSNVISISSERNYPSLADRGFVDLIAAHQQLNDVPSELETRLDYNQFLLSGSRNEDLTRNTAGIANLYYTHQFYAKADEAYAEALQLAKKHLPSLLPFLHNQQALTKQRLAEKKLRDSARDADPQSALRKKKESDSLFVAAQQLYADIFSKSQAEKRWDDALRAVQRQSEAALSLRDTAEVYALNKKMYMIADSLGRETDRSIALNNLGFASRYAGLQDSAIVFFEKALASASAKKNAVLNLQIAQNLAVLYQNKKDLKQASFLLEVTVLGFKNLGMLKEQAIAQDLLATVFLQRNDSYRAIVSNQKSIDNATQGGHADVLAAAFLTKSVIYQSLHEYEEAYTAYKKHLFYRDSLETLRRNEESALETSQFALEQIEKKRKTEYFAATQAKLELSRKTAEAEAERQRNEVLLRQNQLEKAEAVNQKLNADKARAALALLQRESEVREQQSKIDLLNKNKLIQDLELEREKKTKEEAERKNTILEQEGKIKELEIQTQQEARRKLIYVVGGLAALLLIIFFVVVQLRSKNKRIRKQNLVILEDQKVIKAEQEKSDKLLLNVLPPTIAAELKEHGAAKPRHYDSVSVFFSDFAGFTHIAEKLSPEELVHTLDRIFLEFDLIAEKHGLMRIKTIGDAYMAVAGLPETDPQHAIHAVLAATEIRDFMNRFNAEGAAKGAPDWGVRIGIHSGPVVAGVVGIRKFAFDIWGDTVNTAARMESSGAAGQVNISGATHGLVKHAFVCTHRGAVAAKNKGEIDMYFVESVR